MNWREPRIAIPLAVALIALAVGILVAFYHEGGHPDPAWLRGDWEFDAEGARTQLANLPEPMRAERLKAVPGWEHASLSFTDGDMTLRNGTNENTRPYHVALVAPDVVCLGFADDSKLLVLLSRDRVMWDAPGQPRLVWKRSSPR